MDEYLSDVLLAERFSAVLMGTLAALGLLLAALGLALGIAGAWALARLLAGALYEVSPTDPSSFVGVGFVLAAVALLACWIPARRAVRIDPMAALRCQ